MSGNKRTQAQYSLMEQLAELIPLANKAGLYDAADYLQDKVDHVREMSTSDIRCSGEFDDGIADGNLTNCSPADGCGLPSCPRNSLT